MQLVEFAQQGRLKRQGYPDFAIAACAQAINLHGEHSYEPA